MLGVPHPCPHALGAERGTPAPKAVGGVSEPAARTRETSACTPSPAPLASLLVIASLLTARAGAGGLAAGRGGFTLVKEGYSPARLAFPLVLLFLLIDQS